ncbi:hypothetical protein [Azospirillum sp. SYSU D00513]|uniref:hypothetical protein n=1 Tax=Azospirillum sp. SYSU D00513 TaxID=2812561 RepID=UPI001A96C3AE|nr:hypothetical protein [Azospirillum sp. SYSU D00513]
MRNLTTVSPEGLISVHGLGGKSVLWSQKMTDLITECSRRGIDPVDLDSDLSGIPFLQKGSLEIAKRNASLHKAWSGKPGYYKYTQKEYAESFLRKGLMRIAPASSYNNASYNSAIKDDELTIKSFISPYDYDLGFIDPYYLRIAPERCHMFIDQKKPSDHYLFCISVSFDLRYFFDFGCNACICIHNQEEFKTRLVNAVSQKLQNWHVSMGPAEYMDPYFITTLLPGNSPEMYFIKDFEYMYQSEHRLVAIPPAYHNAEMSPFFVELGSLEDIARIVEFT